MINVSNEEKSPLELSREEGRQRIEQEDNLINHRVSWLMTAQSFLLGAFVLLKNNPSYYYTEINKLPGVYIEQSSLLSYLICVSGLVIAVCSFAGVLAAYFAIAAWGKSVRNEERIYLTSDRQRHFFGGLASILPGTVFASIWALLLSMDKAWLRLTFIQFTTPIAGILLGLIIWRFFTHKDFNNERKG